MVHPTATARPGVSRRVALLLVLVAGLAGAGAATAWRLRRPPVPTPTVEVFFSPGQDCTAAVVRTLTAARSEVLVAAYALTSPPIVEALVAARRRGVPVHVVLDPGQKSERYTAADLLVRAGVPVSFNPKGKLAHDKIMVVDEAVVITGSFNFTVNAERNAENLLVLRDGKLARRYIEHWRWCQAGAEAHVAR